MASHDSCTRFYQVRSTQAGRQRIKKTGPIYSRGGSNIVSQAGRRQPSNDARSKAFRLRDCLPNGLRKGLQG